MLPEDNTDAPPLVRFVFRQRHGVPESLMLLERKHMKLWAGRFKKDTDSLMDDFNASIRFDSRMYRQDILGSAAHVRMLGKCGIIPLDEAELIRKTLFEILDDIEQGRVEFDVSAEDIHMNIESILIDRIGQTGKKLHTGRSRNDQVALISACICGMI